MQALRRLCLVLVLTGGYLFVSVAPVRAFNYGSQPYGSCVYGGELGNNALSFSVNTTSVSLGALSPSTTGTGTATFAVTLGCSDRGYTVAVSGTSLTNGSHTITNLSSPTASTTGTEQFGINLVDNATPNIGANPSGGSGTAASGYDTADLFKYVSGNTIASTATYSTQTTYTISFIVNVAPDTPATTYGATYTLVCTATY